MQQYKNKNNCHKSHMRCPGIQQEQQQQTTKNNVDKPPLRRFWHTNLNLKQSNGMKQHKPSEKNTATTTTERQQQKTTQNCKQTKYAQLHAHRQVVAHTCTPTGYGAIHIHMHAHTRRHRHSLAHSHSCASCLFTTLGALVSPKCLTVVPSHMLRRQSVGLSVARSGSRFVVFMRSATVYKRLQRNALAMKRFSFC